MLENAELRFAIWLVTQLCSNVVEEFGPDARGVTVGDRRAVYAWGGCGQCAQCQGGHENLCPKPRNLSIHRDGGFSNYVVVDHPRYLVEYEPLPAPFAATLGCSGLTAFSALRKAAPVDAGNPLMIIGAGGLGLASVGLAQALYGMGPIVADVDAAKRQAAIDAGKTLRVLERRTQASDHPILLTVPETMYLKCLVLEVL